MGWWLWLNNLGAGVALRLGTTGAVAGTTGVGAVASAGTIGVGRWPRLELIGEVVYGWIIIL